MDIDDLNYKIEEMKRELREIELAHPKLPKTLFEVTRYPHFENVTSNVLAFLFDNNEDHGLEDLWIRSLITSLNLESEDSPFASLDSQNEVSVERVEREYPTRNGGRLDLVIETENTCIGIENKLNASLYNNLDDYRLTISSLAQSLNKRPVFVVLHVFPVEVDDPWIEISYEELFASIRRYSGEYYGSSNARWFAYVDDFMRTIEGMVKNMDSGMLEQIRFVGNHFGEIAMIDSCLSESYKWVLDRCNGIANAFNEIYRNQIAMSAGSLKQAGSYKETKRYYSSVFVDAEIAEGSPLANEIMKVYGEGVEVGTICCETICDFTAWRFFFFVRGRFEPGQKDYTPRLDTFFRESGFPDFIRGNYEWQYDDWGRKGWYLSDRSLDLDAPDDDLAKHIYEIIQRLRPLITND